MPVLNMAKSMTEDAVRDLAREALGLVDSEIARAGVGQLTTFNQLGFPGVADKPDGWYLPNNKNEVAVVLETKATRITLGQAQVDEVLKNVRIMQTQYKKVVGILFALLLLRYVEDCLLWCFRKGVNC